jgi:chemotaxis protein MotB
MSPRSSIPPLPESAARLATQPAARKAGGQTWMVTFTDLVALMLTFFVMLFAMMTVEREAWNDLTESLAIRLDRLAPPTPPRPDELLDMPDVRVAPGANIDYLGALLERRLAEREALAGGRVARRIDHLVVSLPGDLLFAPGTARPSEAARTALFDLGGLLQHIDNVVEVAGHADPTAVGNGPFRSNWELSLARAAAVAGMLRAAGVTGEMSALGYGDTRFDALPGDLTRAERMALGRRVEILIHERAGEWR